MRRVMVVVLSAGGCLIQPHPDFVRGGAEGDGGDTSTEAGTTSETTATSTASDGSTTTDTQTGDPDTGSDSTGGDPSQVLFTTSTTHTAQIGGFEAADAICQGLADAAALPGTFVAVLGETTTTVKDRVMISAPVVNTLGEFIAPDADALWNGDVSNSVAFDENAAPVDGMAWTGADVGGSGSANNCMLWSEGVGNGAVGDTGVIGPQWLRSATDSCDLPNRLYCIQQG